MRNVETFELKGFCYIKNTENWFVVDLRFWEILKESPKLRSLYFYKASVIFRMRKIKFQYD